VVFFCGFYALYLFYMWIVVLYIWLYFYMLYVFIKIRQTIKSLTRFLYKITLNAISIGILFERPFFA
jgi:cell shape-determining protein MreC